MRSWKSDDNEGTRTMGRPRLVVKLETKLAMVQIVASKKYGRTEDEVVRRLLLLLAERIEETLTGPLDTVSGAPSK